MPFKSKAQQRFMFARHPRIAKRWARETKAQHKSIKSLPEKVARDYQSPAGYWYGKSTVKRLEGGTNSGTHADKKLPPKGFGTMYGTGKTASLVTRLTFSDELSKLAAGPSRVQAARLARKAAPYLAKRIKGIRRGFKRLRKKLR